MEGPSSPFAKATAGQAARAQKKPAEASFILFSIEHLINARNLIISVMPICLGYLLDSFRSLSSFAEGKEDRDLGAWLPKQS